MTFQLLVNLIRKRLWSSNKIKVKISVIAIGILVNRISTDPRSLFIPVFFGCFLFMNFVREIMRELDKDNTTKHWYSLGFAAVYVASIAVCGVIFYGTYVCVYISSPTESRNPSHNSSATEPIIVTATHPNTVTELPHPTPPPPAVAKAPLSELAPSVAPAIVNKPPIIDGNHIKYFDAPPRRLSADQVVSIQKLLRSYSPVPITIKYPYEDEETAAYAKQFVDLFTNANYPVTEIPASPSGFHVRGMFMYISGNVSDLPQLDREFPKLLYRLHVRILVVSQVNVPEGLDLEIGPHPID